MNLEATTQQAVLVLDDDVKPRDHSYKFHIYSVDQYRDADHRLDNLAS
jgi:hypothetical protein